MSYQGVDLTTEAGQASTGISWQCVFKCSLLSHQLIYQQWPPSNLRHHPRWTRRDPLWNSKGSSLCPISLLPRRIFQARRSKPSRTPRQAPWDRYCYFRMLPKFHLYRCALWQDWGERYSGLPPSHGRLEVGDTVENGPVTRRGSWYHGWASSTHVTYSWHATSHPGLARNWRGQWFAHDADQMGCWAQYVCSPTCDTTY